MTNSMLNPALQYHAEGLCVIPVVSRDKKPALATWEQYHTRCSTEAEIKEWWGNGHNYNIGVVHGEVSGNFITLDIDHDSGLVDAMYEAHPYLFKGRIEQSGSGQGYHVPLRLKELPDFGTDQKQDRPRGNRTWKTKMGDCNIRARFCQTVLSPSIHPSGNPYRFLQDGPITELDNLNPLIAWLNELAPPRISTPPAVSRPTRPQSDDLLGEVRAAWDCLTVFDHFTMAAQQRKEPNGQIRLLGNGGLLITEDLQQFYSFSDEFGGGIFEAWGFCRFGNSYDKSRHFRQVLCEMAEAAGIEVRKPPQKRESCPAVTLDDLPFAIPASPKVIIVGGEQRAEVLRDAGFAAVGLPGNIFKRAWAGLFNRDSQVYIALDPGKERQAELIATEFKANGIEAVACYLPVRVDELLGKYGGTSGDLCQFLNYGKRV